MTPELLLHKFGYLAVFVGTFLEGETILVMAGFFAERGYLHLLGVILTAFAGAFVGHVFWFWLGRTQGVKLLDRMPRMKKHFGRGIRIFERYGAPAIFITQWLYGLRVTCAVIIGISRISTLKFILYEAVTCMIWAIIIASAVSGLSLLVGREWKPRRPRGGEGGGRRTKKPRSLSPISGTLRRSSGI